jgi:hypothetical protein
MLPSLSSGSHSRLARKSVQALLNLGLVGKRSDSRQFRLVETVSDSNASSGRQLEGSHIFCRVWCRDPETKGGNP